MTIEQVLHQSSQILSESGLNNSLRIAEQIIAEVLNQDSAYVIANCDKEISDAESQRVIQITSSHIKGTPLAYAIGNSSFFGQRFLVNNSVLIPRPETEFFVEEIIRLIRKENRQNAKLVDVGTGSGVIAVTLKHYFPTLSVTAGDISEGALDIAEDNANRLKTEVEFVKSDLLQNIKGKFDIIIANLPYIPEGEMDKISPNVTKNEPVLALNGGKDGLELIEKLLEQATSKITDKAIIALEIWHTQANPITDIVEKIMPDKTVQVAKDLNGFDRYIYISA